MRERYEATLEAAEAFLESVGGPEVGTITQVGGEFLVRFQTF